MAIITRNEYDRKSGQLIVVQEENYAKPFPAWLLNKPSADEIYADNRENYCCNMLLPHSGICEICGKIKRR